MSSLSLLCHGRTRATSSVISFYAAKAGAISDIGTLRDLRSTQQSTRYCGQSGLLERLFNGTGKLSAPRLDLSFRSLPCATNNSGLQQYCGQLGNLNEGPLLLKNAGRRDAENLYRSSGSTMIPGLMKAAMNLTPQYPLMFQSFVHTTSQNDLEAGRNSKPMNFVRGIVEDNNNDILGNSRLSSNGSEANADIVHIKMLRNNTFVTITDSKGNKKLGASSGCLPELKKGPKLSRYAAEATAEHVGRLSRNLGLKSVVVKVSGFVYFKKKKQAIASWREGYTYSKGDQHPIAYVEDTTRRPHNGCRLRKKRRF